MSDSSTCHADADSTERVGVAALHRVMRLAGVVI